MAFKENDASKRLAAIEQAISLLSVANQTVDNARIKNAKVRNALHSALSTLTQHKHQLKFSIQKRRKKNADQQSTRAQGA